MEQLRLRTLIGVLTSACTIFALTACGGGGGETPDPQGDPVLTRACDYIRGGAVGTKGGDGGSIYYVDYLTDEKDPETGLAARGTLRYAVEQGDTRMILFRVAGTIHLTRPLELVRGNVTIAGQSAPGEGICLADYPLVIKKCENVIVRYIRVRMGDAGTHATGSEYDAISVNDCRNVVLDHVSACWSVDECVSCYGNENFTMQYCFITESLRKSLHSKGNHGYGGIWGGKNASFHHNLLAHHDSRNPRFDHDYVNTMAGPIDHINNVVYNWGGNSAYGGEGSTKGGGGRQINFVANYYKPGPSTGSGVKERLMNPWATCDNCTKSPGGSVIAPHLYIAGNAMPSEKVTADNWQGVHYSGGATEEMCRVNERYTFVNCITGEQTATEAYETVLAKGGCSYRRDAYDTRIVGEVRDGKGRIIDNPSDVGGWPVLKAESPAKDTDGDGIPDEWETAHGLNPKSYKDHKEMTLVPGHTNLDVYLCDIVKDLY